ncbi:E3 ubiquitin-protein ligase Midline-1-like [Patella vulgata]|uniref:E3 ubiquitin-protein ligase Midline-1-like n=1 Tax=Patella vulgata TaxID=6465 RepID=UPI00217FDE5C|nr:E3 ubiquitin-protein ligase Midline-1-like [Patella vulgata]
MEDQEDNCSICLNIFTEPKTIDCGHRFCGDCLEDYYTKKCSKSKNFPCPLCRHNVGVPVGGIKMFPSTNSKKRKIERKSASSVSGIVSLPSTSCSTEGEAMHVVSDQTEKVILCDACKSCDNEIYKCIECNKYMCCSCKNTHHDVFFADHHVFIVQHQDKQTRERIRPCTQHTLEKLELYCKDCSVAVCKTCLTQAHQDHDTLEICDYRDEVEHELLSLKGELESKSSEFEKYVGEVKKKINSMNKSAQTSCSKIDQHVKNICDVVFQRGETLKKDLKKTLQEEEQKMKKIVDGTKDMIGRMAKIAQNITDILIGDCVYDIVDVLTMMRRQRDELESRDLVSLHDVTSKHHTMAMGVNYDSLFNIVGEFRVARQTTTTLKHGFNYGVLKDRDDYDRPTVNNKENEWVYGPAFKLQDCSLYIRVKSHSDKTNTTFVFGNTETPNDYVDVGLYVDVGDSINKSSIQSFTVKADMKLIYVDSGSKHKEAKTYPSTQTFTSSIGVLTWNKVGFYRGSNIECTATVDITMTTVI